MTDFAPLAGVLTFLMVIGIVLGAYWLGVVRLEGEERHRLRARALGGRSRPAAALDLLRETVPLSAVQGFNALLLRMSFLTEPLRLFIAQSGVKTTVGAVILATCTLFATTLWVAALLGAGLFIAAICAVVAALGPFVVLRRARTRRIRKIEEQFPEGIDLLARSLRAGHAFTAGLRLAGTEVPDPLGLAFRLLHDRHNYGEPLPSALRQFADELMLVDARFFATAVLTQREAGGNLAEVLDHLSAVIRDRFRIKREIRVRSAHGRMTGYVIAAMPPILFVYLWFVNPERVLILLTDPLGIQMLGGAVLMQVVGTLVIRRIVDIRY